MGRIFKYFLWLVGGFATLFVLAAIALYGFFDPNDFREDISKTVRNQTGRELTIDGDISLDLFPWLAVEVGSASLGNAPGFGTEPMASFERASFSVRLIPIILRQEVVVGAVNIDSLRLNLVVNEHGDSNWSDLIAEETNTESETVSGSAGDLNVNSVKIIDAMITYTNAESDEVIVIDGMNLSIGRLKDDGSSVPIDAELTFDMQPAGLTGAMTLDTVMTYDAETGELRFDGVSIDGSVAGVASIPTRMKILTDSIKVSTNESTVTVQPVDLTMLDMHIVADVQPFSYADVITLRADIAVDAFSPRSVMHLFDVEPPVTADPVALSRVIFDASAELTPTAIELTDVSIKLDDTSFSGSLSIPRTATGFYQFDLSGDSINLNRYMEPTVEAADRAGAESAPVEIPVDLIAPLNARGKLTLTAATLGNMVFENVDLGLNSSGGKMRIFPISSDLFGGSYSGDVRIDVSGAVPSLAMNEKIERVDLAALVKAMFDQENVTGTVGGSFVLTGKGDDMVAIQRSLAGNMSLELTDGTYVGTDLWYELRRARALLKGASPPDPVLPAKTAFSTVRVSGVVTNGVMRSDDLFAELPFMQLTGGGQVDLVAATVDYNVTARILKRPEFLRDATPEELDEFTEAVIPLKISGPIASPRIAPDLENLLRKRVEDEIKDRLKDKLKDLFDL